MKEFYTLLLVLTILNTAACQKDLPEPEAKLSIIPMSYVDTSDDVPVAGSQRSDSFLVQHHTKGNSVFVECMISDISFRDQSKNKGKILLYVDGKKKDEISTAAFIIKGLSSGSHNIKLEVVNTDGQPYDLRKDFTVTIP